MAKQLQAVATVTVTMEIRLHQPWGEDCGLPQILKQAKDDAGREVSSLIRGKETTFTNVRIDQTRVSLIESER